VPLEVLPSLRHRSSHSVQPAVFHNVLYDTDYVSTDGGTIVLAWCQGQILGVTCRHVVKLRSPDDLLIHFDPRKMEAWKPHQSGYIQGTDDALAESEVEDVLLLALDRSGAGGSTQAISIDQSVEPEIGDHLVVAGFPRARMECAIPLGRAVCFETDICDKGRTTNDPHLRCAGATFTDVEPEPAEGLSGSLVFNLTKQAPAGIVLRASKIQNDFCVYYIPFARILPLIQAFAVRTRARQVFEFNLHFGGPVKDDWITV